VVKIGAYYNEIDPKAAAWLRELIKAGLIADGEVDERSIVDVSPGDVRGFVQCHWFAGIGGWSYALRLAGWADDRPVWTGSCPCQPFSSAGRGVGGDDPRHLWPAWFGLIAECRPATIFGEQVESAVNHGWLDLVCDDLEREGYATGAASLPAPSVGAFHIRQRVWFVADAPRERCPRERLLLRPEERGRHAGEISQTAGSGQAGELAHPEYDGRQRHAGDRRQAQRWAQYADELGNADEPGSQGWIVGGISADQRAPWATSLVEWIDCSDGKRRPVEPGTFPLAHGIPARVGRLRGYGNAIVPQVAAAFIQAYQEARG
jgi:DNA (cytosine-5)-methyltransferase 1